MAQDKLTPFERLQTREAHDHEETKRRAAVRFDYDMVRVGRERGGQAELVSGLEEGQLFVARGALLLLNAIDLTR
jgi:hypothetical protein